MKQLIRKSLPFYLYPASNYHLKVNDRTRCEICSKITLKTPELRQWRRSGVFIVNFEHVIVGWVKIKGVYLLQTKQVELTEQESGADSASSDEYRRKKLSLDTFQQ